MVQLKVKKEYEEAMAPDMVQHPGEEPKASFPGLAAEARQDLALKADKCLLTEGSPILKVLQIPGKKSLVL